MKKKIILNIFILIILLGVTTGCGSKKEENKEEKNNQVKEDPINTDVSKEYTKLKIYGKEVKFKKHELTYFWDAQDNFGTAEIDTFYLVSKNGEKIEDIYSLKTISGIAFYVSDDIKADKKELQYTYGDWERIELEITDPDEGLFKRHMKGENDSLYLEAYCFKYEGKFGKEKTNVNYKIELRIDKSKYSEVEIEKIKAEFHTIIDTFELIK